MISFWRERKGSQLPEAVPPPLQICFLFLKSGWLILNKEEGFVYYFKDSWFLFKDSVGFQRIIPGLNSLEREGSSRRCRGSLGLGAPVGTLVEESRDLQGLSSIHGPSSPRAREPSGGHLTGQDLGDMNHSHSRGSETVSTGSGHLGVHKKQVGKGWESPSWLHLVCRLYLIRVPTFSSGITCLAHFVALSHLPLLKHLGRKTDQGTERGPCPSLLRCSHHAPVPLSLSMRASQIHLSI